MGSPVTLDVHTDDDWLVRELRADVRSGLTATPRWLAPRWFYDDVGSRLFDDITRLPEYYLFRCETEILTRHADDIARMAGRTTVVELGSGYSTKTRLLLDALARDHSLARIVTLDVSAAALVDAAGHLAERYPDVPVHPIVGDYTHHLGTVPPAPPGARRLLVFLGSTLGNLIPDERTHFLSSCASALRPGEHFLVGTDLVKPEHIVQPAYDDAAGVTARFNRNILHVIRRLLNAHVEPDAFAHEARWDPDAEWVQVALRATRPTVIDVPDLVCAEFQGGDRILTEVSAKFTTEGLDRELDAAGFDTTARWLDERGWFAVTLATRR